MAGALAAAVVGKLNDRMSKNKIITYAGLGLLVSWIIFYFSGFSITGLILGVILVDLAEKYDIPVDFHLDFDLNPKNSSIPILVQETLNRNCEGRVGIGHVTNLSAKQPQSR